MRYWMQQIKSVHPLEQKSSSLWIKSSLNKHKPPHTWQSVQRLRWTRLLETGVNNFKYLRLDFKEFHCEVFCRGRRFIGNCLDDNLWIRFHIGHCQFRSEFIFIGCIRITP